MMRILNVIMCLDPVSGGGSVERVHQLSRQLALMGEDCTILTTKQGWSEEYSLKLGKVKVVALPYFSGRFRIPIGIFNWLKLNIRNYDIVHLAMNWTVINIIVYLYLRYYKRPYVYSAMGWLVIDGRLKLIKHIYRKLFTQSMIRQAKVCIAITKREVNDYVSLGVDKTKVSLIPNGITIDPFLIDPDRELFRLRCQIDSRPFILFIGRLNLIKGPDLLLKAFAGIAHSFADYQLVIVGNNYGLLDELKQLAQFHKISNKVIFLGPIFGKEKLSAYSSAELFVIPSRFDTMTIVALEAAASGVPVLLTKQCDFDELQEAGGGLSVEANVESLQKGLNTLLANREKLKAMGDRGKEYVLKTYNWNRVGQQFIDIFKKAAFCA